MDPCTLYAPFTPALFNLSHRVHTLCKEEYGHGGRDVQSSKRHAGYKYGVTQARLVFQHLHRLSSPDRRKDTRAPAEWKALLGRALRLPSSSSRSVFMLIDLKEQSCVTRVVIVLVYGFEESPPPPPTLKRAHPGSMFNSQHPQAENRSGTLNDILLSTS